jgi:radical SAM family protein/iron-sulfur cluster protein
LRSLVIRSRSRAQATLGKSPAARKLIRDRSIPLMLRRPSHVGIEITAACNARCTMCPRHEMDRPMRPMPFPLFQRIVDQCAALGVHEIALNGYGEIFTLRREKYREYIDYCRRVAPDVRVVINTNAYEMTEEVARYLIEAGVWAVHVNLDGATAETFEKIRVHLTLDQCERNILRLMELKRAMGKVRPQMRVGIIEMPETSHEIDQFEARWRGKVDVVAVDGYVNRMGDGAFTYVIDQSRPCFDLWSKLHIWANGQAVLCCEDWNATHVVGDALTQTIEEIWQGEALTSARAKHLAGQGKEIPMCAGCGYWRRGPYWWFDDDPAGFRRVAAALPHSAEPPP